MGKIGKIIGVAAVSVIGAGGALLTVFQDKICKSVFDRFNREDDPDEDVDEGEVQDEEKEEE